MVEDTIKSALNYLWAESGKVDPERFAIGIDKVSWDDIAKNKDLDVAEVILTIGQKDYLVIPLGSRGDLPTGTVALVWRKAE
ncbi:hypothetical protein LCGC14_0329700 [marine sediment metagenome]|uniref:Uncharacterized protein n=1 Tax=marine sediment metagenome TaxID=412755 RepID=A0A0F9TZF6_9ZZZZ